jgi:uncharacterized protein (UPF0332 family)
MDWKTCLKKSLSKKIKPDKNLIDSLLKSAKKKIEAEKQLPNNFSEPKISLAYDVLRTILEVLALSKGFKIYNHECYTSFLKEILNESNLGDRFDKFRKLRNAVNYYGKEVGEKESLVIIKEIKELVKILKNKL